MNAADNQILLATDERGRFTGEYIPRELAHRGDGRRHLAIAVLLHNARGELLLQRRRHHLFDDLWDLTGATHPLHREDAADESFEQAAARCLAVEYDIRGVTLETFGAFNYFARHGEQCENEHCALLIGTYDGPVRVNPQVGYGFRWMAKHDFARDIDRHPERYTAWARESARLLRRAGWLAV
ncbi:MAG TPA: NUDIX domain-containing protein [Acidobacteriota bacterium]